MISGIRKVLDTLESSLIYHMSLGSKELFHSNVWSFLLEKEPKFIKVFLPNLGITEYTVHREKENRDIVICYKLNGKKEHICIENKIKTLPTERQLEKYTKDLGKGYAFKHGVLTGLQKDSPIDFSKNEKLKYKWSYLSYKEISMQIEKIAKDSRVKEIKENLDKIIEYCEVIDAIDTCIHHFLEQSDKRLKYECKECKGLEKIRFLDVFKKLKGSEFLNYAKKEIEKDEEIFNVLPNKYEFIVGQEFNRANVTLTFTFALKGKEQEEKDIRSRRTIGVQLEGNQFRVFAQRKNEKSFESLFKALCKKGWFDDFFDAAKGKIEFYGKKYDTSMKPRGKSNKYNSYSKTNLIYQYFNINETNDSYEDLNILIRKFLKESAKILKTNPDLFN